MFASQGPKVKQFMDIFSIPEMTLLAVANHLFITNDIEYDPVHLFKDVSVRALTDSPGIRRFSSTFKWAPYLVSHAEKHSGRLYGFVFLYCESSKLPRSKALGPLLQPL